MQPSDTAAFLRYVLPAEGYYCAVIFDSPDPKPGVDRPHQIVCETIDQLAHVLLANDAAGRTVYHACASFKDPHGVLNSRTGKREFRSHPNAARAKALWFDIDAGPGKPYPDAYAAAEHLAAFVGAAGLPQPLYVGSGNGVHGYFGFDSSISPEQWQPIASGLKELALQRGLHIDRARTGDISSILRPPGSHNRKRGVINDVVCGEIPDAQPVGRFEFLAGIGSAPAARSSVQRPQSVSERISGFTAYSAVYADAIADKCGQVAALRNSGSIPEPQWYAVLGVLSRCEDGELKAHEWSAKDFPGYSPSETQFKFERTKTLTGATTCLKFHDLEPSICNRCALFEKINSPITLGASIQDGAISISPTPPEIPADTAEGVVQLPVLPEPFRWSSTGQLTFLTENKAGEYDATIVTEHPVFLDGVQVGELDHGSFSYKFRRYFPQDGWKDAIIDATMVHSSSGISAFAGRGIVVHDSKLFLNYVRHAVDEFHTNEPVATRYDQLGWKHEGDTSFLYGANLYTPAGPITAAGAKEVVARSQWLGPKRGGNLYAWTDAADQLFATDLEAISAAVLASFAAPLMKFQSPNEGGAILHLYTPESGKGKTTALQGAWTVWGEKYGLNLTNDDTRVSKPIALGVLGNLPIIYDELRDRDPEVIKKFVIMFTEGRDRMRGDPTGGIRHTKATWQTVLLSAANNSLIDVLTGEGTDAPSYRVLELTTNPHWTMDKARADKLKQQLDQNAGHAADAYLRYLLQPTVLAWTKQALEEWTGQIWKSTGLGTEYRFRVRLIGAIAVASALVNKLDILHFDTNRIIQWLLKELSAEHNAGNISSVSTIDRAVATLGEFINEHYGETLAVIDRWKPKNPKLIPILRPHNRLTVRYEVNPARVFISAQSFRDWAIKRQISPRTVLAMLKAHGVVIDTHRNITLSAGTDIPGAQILCIEANAAHPCMSGLVMTVAQVQQAANSN